MGVKEPPNITEISQLVSKILQFRHLSSSLLYILGDDIFPIQEGKMVNRGKPGLRFTKIWASLQTPISCKFPCLQYPVYLLVLC